MPCFGLFLKVIICSSSSVNFSSTGIALKLFNFLMYSVFLRIPVEPSSLLLYSGRVIKGCSAGGGFVSLCLYLAATVVGPFLLMF